ncbi:hypothetical protein PLICRDRAFT_178056 [Plicaturopsis crispa FD-325 SS-3]|nr:hypothetical protein PLICRDRAFT_178056 [Plicaturopsis crispa FD-325 SS-3]
MLMRRRRRPRRSYLGGARQAPRTFSGPPLASYFASPANRVRVRSIEGRCERGGGDGKRGRARARDEHTRPPAHYSASDAPAVPDTGTTGANDAAEQAVAPAVRDLAVHVSAAPTAHLPPAPCMLARSATSLASAELPPHCPPHPHRARLYGARQQSPFAQPVTNVHIGAVPAHTVRAPTAPVCAACAFPFALSAPHAPAVRARAVPVCPVPFALSPGAAPSAPRTPLLSPLAPSSGWLRCPHVVDARRQQTPTHHGSPLTPLHTDITQRTHKRRLRLPAHNNNASAFALAPGAGDPGDVAPSHRVRRPVARRRGPAGQHTSAEEGPRVRQPDDGAPHLGRLVQPDPRLYRVHQPRHTAVSCGVATADPHPRRLVLSDGRAR